MSKKKIGTITLGEKTMLSDPCYGVEDTFCNVIIDTIPGEYNVYVTYTTSKWDDKCITSIIAIHKDYIKKYRTPNNEENLSCAVDSGTCGIFNLDYYKEYHSAHDVNDEWYDNNVVKIDDYTITDNKGAITTSGGDGSYPIYAEYKDNVAYSLRIKFR